MAYISKELSDKILTIGVSKASPGGMASVLISYEKCFERMRYIPSWNRGSKLLKAWYSFQAILRCYLLLMFDKRIKILHIHGAANASFPRKAIFVKMGKRFRKKVIMHQHAADFEHYFEQSNDKQRIVDTLNLCDLMIVLSQSWKKYFAGIGVAEENICVLNNIVFPPDNTVNKKADNKLHLLFLGEIGKRKGIYDLLNVMTANKEYFKDKVILRVGGNLADGDINAVIAENDLSSFVKYEGWVSGAKKTECLEWADVYILPSYNEGLPIAILEAMSYSYPVISTNVGGIPEILRSNENGFLIEAGNLEQMQDAISFFIENPEKISEYGKNAYQTVQPFFPGAVFGELEKIYDNLLK